MANNSCKRNSPMAKLVKRLALLKEEFIKNQDNELEEDLSTTTQLSEQIQNIKQVTQFNDPTITDAMFKQALIDAGLDTTIDSDNENNVGESLLQIEELNYDGFKQIYRNAVSAHAHMLHLLKSQLFQNAFVNTKNYGDQTDSRGRKLNDTVRRIPTSAAQFNNGIVNFKNELFDIIVKNLGFYLDVKPFSRRGADLETIKAVMKDSKTLSFLNRMRDTLETAATEDLDTHAALVILNNFDKLLKKELGNVIKIDADNLGKLDNIQYISETEDNYTSHWITDDLESYGSELYQTNIGKFILGTIQKVDSQGRPIPGRYMTSGDAFMVSDILKNAELLYHILKPKGYDENLSFKRDTKKALKTLLESNLPIIEKFRKEVLPIYNYLYKDTDLNFSIRTITKEILDKKLVDNVNVLLNVEDILAFELAKNVAPAYLEYSLSGKTGNGKLTRFLARPIALGHSYKTNSYISDNLKAQALNQLQLNFTDRNKFLSAMFPASKYRAASLDELLTADNLIEFRDAFKLLFNTELNRELLDDLGYGTLQTAMRNIVDLMFTIQNVFNMASAEKTIETQGDSFLNGFESRIENKSSQLNPFYSNLLQVIADKNSEIPNTVIKDSRNKSIPIYRINSTIFEHTYLLNKLRKDHPFRENINFFSGNRHALSNINDPSSVGGLLSENRLYPGNTAIRLETILPLGSTPAKKSSGLETFLNSIFGEFLSLGLQSHSFGTQLMTYSDKVSGFVNIVNLDSIVKKYGDKEVNKSLWKMSNEELFDMFYFYRKNQLVDRVYHILKDWEKTGLVGKLDLPELYDISDFNSSADLSSDLFDKLTTAWKQVNTSIENLTAEEIESTIRSVKEIDPDFELTKELHYSNYNGVLRLNKNIYYHLSQVKDKNTFRDLQRGYTHALYKDSWFDFLTSFLKTSTSKENDEMAGIKEELRGQIQQLAHEFGINSSELFPEELLYRRTLLDNFFRIQFNDLHFKGPHLDTIKKVNDYDETNAQTATLWLAEEKKRFEAAGKRTVDLPGTKENFAQGLINGVPVKAKVAIINEFNEQVFNPMGDKEDKFESNNGSAWIHPIYAYQETASLPGENFSGENRKVLGMDMSDYRATLFKYAEYMITNWRMRTSERSKYRLQWLFKKMSDIKFTEDIDLTKSFFDPDSHFTPKMANDGKDVYFAKGINYYKLVDIKKVGENLYDLVIKIVDEYGGEYENQVLPSNIETKNVSITSLYDLFTKTLGGIESMSLVNGKLLASESSLKMLYNYVTNIGEIVDSSDTFNQTTVRQPLRDYFYSMAVSNSGIKRGETNTNSENVYENSDDLIGFSIETACFGKQLDATHQVDETSTISNPTQVEQGLATNGNTQKEAQETYEAIAQIIRSNMKEVNRTVYKLNLGSIEPVINELSKELYKVISVSNDINQAQSIADLINIYLGSVLPISDPNMYRLFHVQSIIDLNRLGLRQKLTGIGGVLNPSVNTMQLFSSGILDGQDLTYDDLIRIGRELANSDLIPDTVDLSDLTTEDVVALAIFSLSDTGLNYSWSTLTRLIVDDISNAIKENYSLKHIDTKLDDSLARNLIKYVGREISAGEVDPLDTVFIVREDGIYKKTLDNIQEIYDLMNEQDAEIYLDLSTPHDLKPLRVLFEFNGEPTNIYQTAASLVAFQIASILDDNKELGKLLDELEDSGAETINSCEL